MRLLKSILVVLCLLACATTQGKNFLFKNGKSSYTIVVSHDASTSEQKAATELQMYIKQISGGVTLPIRHDLNRNGENQIAVGFQPEAGAKAIAADNEDFTYESRGSNIYIYGGSNRGTMYGVFSFLERELGIRWYTPDYTKVPKMKKWGFDTLSHSEHPTVKLRQNDYFHIKTKPEWSAHNLMNMAWSPAHNEYGGMEAYRGCHTMPSFVPYDKYFAEHPEYFCFREGKRENHGQLCLSNPDVLELCKKGMLQKMREEPDFIVYSLSQDDNWKFCECDECKAIEAQYGGTHSGIIVWFVNQVADYVKEEFPDKFIGTFAYLYSRKPPVGIVPRDNVVIRLCSIECCYSHPMDDPNCEQNKAFVDDLKQWASIAPHLFIWDYIINYLQLVAPFPNFKVLAPNIRTLRDNHSIGIFEESQYMSNAGEFAELRAWVIAHLLWNPDQDVTPLAKDFIYGFYGECAPLVWKYYLMSQELAVPNEHFGIYINHRTPIYTDKFVEEGMALLDKARQKAKSDEMRDRIDYLRLQTLYLKASRKVEESKADGTWEELVTLAKKHKVKLCEWESLEGTMDRLQKEK